MSKKEATKLPAILDTKVSIKKIRDEFISIRERQTALYDEELALYQKLIEIETEDVDADTGFRRKARVKVAPKADSQAGIILRYIRECGAAGACDFEGIRDLAHLIPTIDNCYRARRGRLAENDMIKLAGYTRFSPSGSECDVWIATPGDSNESGPTVETGGTPGNGQTVP